MLVEKEFQVKKRRLKTRRKGIDGTGLPEKLASAYITAKSFVIAAGYDSEIKWQESTDFEHIQESDFLREAAWVILSSGMRETIIRQKFPVISKAFFNWQSAEKIIRNKEKCIECTLRFFRHRRKIEAIIQVSAHVFKKGFQNVWSSIEKGGVAYIMQFPYMGPATSYHFAKNIGLPVAKPDRHLKRIAQAVGYSSPQSMCGDIAAVTSEKIPVVDLILWRFATLNSDYIGYFKSSL